MLLSSAPAKIAVPFASGGSKNTIPVTTGTPGAASFTVGFPPETMEPVTSGGVPPSGLDFNGLHNQGGSVIDQWTSAGAGFKFDSVFAAAVGGYPQGARVLNSAGTAYWRSIIDNNSNDPDAGGAGWVPDSSSGVIASVYASAQQTLNVGNAKILWDTVEFDSFGLWDATNHRFKALWAGKYRFNGSLYLSAPAAQALAIQVWKNGVLAKECFRFPQMSDVDISLPFEAVISLAANDYLEAYLVVTETNVSGGIVGSNQPYVFGQIQFLGN